MLKKGVFLNKKLYFTYMKKDKIFLSDRDNLKLILKNSKKFLTINYIQRFLLLSPLLAAMLVVAFFEINFYLIIFSILIFIILYSILSGYSAYSIIIKPFNETKLFKSKQRSTFLEKIERKKGFKKRELIESKELTT